MDFFLGVFPNLSPRASILVGYKMRKSGYITRNVFVQTLPKLPFLVMCIRCVCEHFVKITIFGNVHA